MALRLGEGIAEVKSKTIFPNTFGVRYVPGKDVLGGLEIWGRAMRQGQEESISKSKVVDVGELTFYQESIWIKKENGEAEVLHDVDTLARVQEFIKTHANNPLAMGDIGEENNPKSTIIRNVHHEDESITHEVWKTKQPEDNQVLLDSIFCLQFNEPAIDKDGNSLSQEEIMKIANHVGNMFKISSTGEVILPTV